MNTPTPLSDDSAFNSARNSRRVGKDIQMLSPQAVKVLEHLEATGTITALEANGVLKVRSVSRRITELVDAGFEIVKEHKRDSTGQRYVRYDLI